MKTLLVSLLAISAAVSLRAGAVVGATEFTQLANNFELVASYGQQAQQTLYQADLLAKQIEAFKVQLQNTKKLDGLNWDGATDTLNQLVQTMRQGEGIAYTMAQEDEAFKKLNDGFVKFTQGTPNAADMAGQYKAWSAYNAQVADKAAAAAGLTQEQAYDEAARIANLKSRAQSAQGQMQALDAGLALSAEILDQLRLLKQLTSIQIETQAKYRKVQEAKAQAEQDDAQKQLTQTPSYDTSKPAKSYGPRPQK